MNCRFTVVVLLLAVSMVGCGKMEDNKPAGTWIGQSAVEGGKARGFRETWTFHDGKITVDEGDDAKYGYQVDATKEPKQIDIRPYVESTSDWKGRMGIYKIENDTLTICSLIRSKAKADAKRPEEFDATKRDDVVVLTFRKKN
jgi:uncharacterized protein (TIGR03067 family)